jgi:GTP-binding protein Era
VKEKSLSEDKTTKLSTVPKILVLNKMDLCFNKRKLRWLITELEDLTKFDKTFMISSLTGFGV